MMPPDATSSVGQSGADGREQLGQRRLSAIVTAGLGALHDQRLHPGRQRVVRLGQVARLHPQPHAARLEAGHVFRSGQPPEVDGNRHLLVDQHVDVPILGERRQQIDPERLGGEVRVVRIMALSPSGGVLPATKAMPALMTGVLRSKASVIAVFSKLSSCVLRRPPAWALQLAGAGGRFSPGAGENRPTRAASEPGRNAARRGARQGPHNRSSAANSGRRRHPDRATRPRSTALSGGAA